VLRAEAGARLGHKDNALADLRKAIELDPGDDQANRRLLHWGSDAEKVHAPHSILARANDATAVAGAIEALEIANRVGSGTLRSMGGCADAKGQILQYSRVSRAQIKSFSCRAPKTI
jgi:hypothetical protein